jgi:streptogrisin C
MRQCGRVTVQGVHGLVTARLLACAVVAGLVWAVAGVAEARADEQVTTLTAVDDCTLSSDWADSCAGTLRAGQEYLGGHMLHTLHATVAFDVDEALPEGAELVKATLNLTPITADDGDSILDVHALTSAWDGDDATWYQRTATAEWTNPGGDFASSIESAVDFESCCHWDVTALARDWLSGQQTNRGVVIAPDEEQAPFIWEFESTESTSGAPTLELMYDPEPLPEGVEDPGVQEAAIWAYRDAYGVSEAVAEERIEIQDAAVGLAESLETAMGDAYGGMWFDAGDEGRVKVGVAMDEPQPAQAAAVDAAQDIIAEQGVTADTDIIGVPESRDDLLAAEPDLTDDLDALVDAGKVRTGLDSSQNALVVQTADTVTSGEMETIEDAADAAPVEVQIDETGEPAVAGDDSGCDFFEDPDRIFCDAPLRGGVKIDSNVACTAGFMTKSQSDDKRYLMTAGHCLRDDGGAIWKSRSAVGSGLGRLLNIGYEWAWEYGPLGNRNGKSDVGIISVPKTSEWYSKSTAGYVVVAKSTNAPSVGSTKLNLAYPIYHTKRATTGQIVCTTGNPKFDKLERSWGTSPASHTRCGHVVLEETSDTRNGKKLLHLFTVNICAAKNGQSGGPAYKENTAFGVLSGSYGCTVWFSDIKHAQSSMNVYVLQWG